MSAVLERLRKQQEECEEKRMNELYNIIQEYEEAHPDNRSKFPLIDLEEKLMYVHALNEIERLERARERRRLAEAAAVLAKHEDVDDLEQSDNQDTSEGESSENDSYFSSGSETNNDTNTSTDSFTENVTAIYTSKICDPPIADIDMDVA